LFGLEHVSPTYLLLFVLVAIISTGWIEIIKLVRMKLGNNNK